MMTRNTNILPLLLCWLLSMFLGRHAVAVEVCGPDAAPSDPGYEAGRAHDDFDGDGCADFCRVVGIAPNNERVSCLISHGPLAVREVLSGNVEDGKPFDWGHAWTRAWIDINDDGKTDYCRNVDSQAPNSEAILRCTLSAGDRFGGAAESNGLSDWGREDQPRSYEFIGDAWHVCFVARGTPPAGTVCHSVRLSDGALQVSEKPALVRDGPASAE